MANVKDYAIGIVATAPSPATSGTSLILQTSQGGDMPNTPFKATLVPPGTIPTRYTAEKVIVTNVSSDTLTIVRAQGVTSAKTVAVGWLLVNAIFQEDLFSSSMVMDELMTGTVNGSNAVFTTSQPFSAIIVSVNGVTMHVGASYDYTITGNNQITFNAGAIPISGNITATYITGSQVLVNGSNSLIYKELPQESANGSRTTFTAQRPYVGGTLQVFINGLMEGLGVTETNPAAGTFTLDFAWPTGTEIEIAYQYSATVSGNADTVDSIHANTTATANQLFPLNSNAKYPSSIIDWSTFSNNIKSASNSGSISPGNTSNDFASNGLSLSFTLSGAGYAFVSVDMGIYSSTDFEFQPQILLGGSVVKRATPSAALGNGSGRSQVRGLSWLVPLVNGSNVISAGANLSSSTGATLPAAGATIAAIVLGNVTA